MPLAEGVLIIFALANQLLLMVLFLANAIFQRANFAIVKIEKESVSDGYTHRQYEILCNLIRQKNIEKKFFDFLLNELYDLSDWKKLTYDQAYELIHILTYWNYKKERK